MPELRVTVHEDPAMIGALAQAWDALLDPQTPNAVYSSAAWLLPWWKSYGGGRQPRILTADRGERLVGVLPAYSLPTLGGNQVRLLGDGLVGSDHLGTIAAPEEGRPVAEAFASHLLHHEADLLFERMSTEDPLLGALVRARPKTVRLEWREVAPCPAVAIHAYSGFSEWLASLPRGTGGQWLRRRRWFEKQSGFRLRVVTDRDSLGRGLDDLFRLHRERWSSEGGSQGIVGTTEETFHRQSAQRLAERGWARLFLLDAAGASRAALYGFERGGRFTFYQSGHEPAWRPHSPGTVLLGSAIERAFSEGLAEFDLGHGDEPYKALFATTSRALVTLRLSTTPRARLTATLDSLLRSTRALAPPALKRLVRSGIRR